MGFTEILTLIFVVLKLLGVIEWGWLLVFLPEIIALAIYAVIVVLLIIGANRRRKKAEKWFADLQEKHKER